MRPQEKKHPVIRPGAGQVFACGLAAGFLPFLDVLGDMSRGDLVFRLFMLPVLAGCLLVLMQVGLGWLVGGMVQRPALMAWGRESRRAGGRWWRRLKARWPWLAVILIILALAGGAWLQADRERQSLVGLFAAHAERSETGWRKETLETFAPLVNPWTRGLDRTEVSRQVSLGSPSPDRQVSYLAACYRAYLETDQARKLEAALSGRDVTVMKLDGRPVIDNRGLHPIDRKAARLKLASGSHALEIYYFAPLGRAHLAAEIPAELAAMLRPLAAAAPRAAIWRTSRAVERWRDLAWFLAAAAGVLAVWLLAPFPRLAPPRILAWLRRRWPSLIWLAAVGAALGWRAWSAGAGLGPEGWLAQAQFMSWSGVFPLWADTWSSAVGLGYPLWLAMLALPPGIWLPPLALALLNVLGLALGGSAMGRLGQNSRMIGLTALLGLCPWLILAMGRPDALAAYAVLTGGLVLFCLTRPLPWGGWAAALLLGLAWSLEPRFAVWIAAAPAICLLAARRLWPRTAFWLAVALFLVGAYAGARSWLSGLGELGLAIPEPGGWVERLTGLGRAAWPGDGVCMAAAIGLWGLAALVLASRLRFGRGDSDKHVASTLPAWLLPLGALFSLAATYLLVPNPGPSDLLLTAVPLALCLASGLRADHSPGDAPLRPLRRASTWLLTALVLSGILSLLPPILY